jgi:hypothetical protein
MGTPIVGFFTYVLNVRSLRRFSTTVVHDGFPRRFSTTVLDGVLEGFQTVPDGVLTEVVET